MRVLLVRHGEAVDPRVAGSDVDRWLTDEGRRTVLDVAGTITEMGLACTRILTSPLVRAVQTAELLARAQPSYQAPIEAHRALASEQGTTAEAIALLDEAHEDDIVAMVTHVPKIGTIAAHLADLPRVPGFGTAEVCLIEVRRGRGDAVWMLDPESLSVRRF